MSDAMAISSKQPYLVEQAIFSPRTVYNILLYLTSVSSEQFGITVLGRVPISGCCRLVGCVRSETAQ